MKETGHLSALATRWLKAGGTVRWRRALFVSLFLHVAVGLPLGLWFRAAPEQSRTSLADGPQVRLGGHGAGGEGSARDKGQGSGEEAAEPFDSNLRSLLIEPKLTPPLPLDIKAVESSGPREGKGPPTGAAAPSGGAGRVRGGAKGATFFDVGARAKKIVYVIDASASMGKDGLWERASRELSLSVEELDADVQFQIIVYNSKARSLLPTGGWLHPTRETCGQILNGLARLVPEGRTDHGPALNLALSLAPEVVFFLTDADDLPLALLSRVDGWNRAGAVIHTFELQRREPPRPGTPMQLLAQRHRGQYLVVPRDR